MFQVPAKKNLVRHNTEFKMTNGHLHQTENVIKKKD